MRMGQSAATFTPENTGYLNTLGLTAQYIDNQLLPAARAQLAQWEADARIAGVHEANIIAVLRSWNAWDQATADLSSVVIPIEMQRVQQGGALGSISDFQPTNPPALLDIDALIDAQGGARTGEEQYTGPISPVESPPVVFSPVQTPEPPPGTTPGPTMPPPETPPTREEVPNGEEAPPVVVAGEPGTGRGAIWLGVAAVLALLVFRKRGG